MPRNLKSPAQFNSADPLAIYPITSMNKRQTAPRKMKKKMREEPNKKIKRNR